MSTATWIRDELDRRGITYQESQHPDAFTAQEVAHGEHVSGHRVAKVVCVIADGLPVELVLPASRQVNLSWVQELLDAGELRLANEDELARCFPDCELGAIPALVALVGWLFLLGTLGFTDPKTFLYGALMIALGAIVYRLFARSSSASQT